MIEISARVSLVDPVIDFWLTLRGSTLIGQSGREVLVPMSALHNEMQAAWDARERGSTENVLVAMSATVARFLRQMYDGKSDARLVEIRVSPSADVEYSFTPGDAS